MTFWSSDLPTIEVQLLILGASHLPNKDAVLLSDPFVKCTVPGRVSVVKFQTHALHNDHNPFWNFQKTVEWDGAGDMVFEVWDEDMATPHDHDYIGSLGFNAGQIRAGNDKDLPLRDDPDASQGSAAPTILGQDGQQSMLYVRIVCKEEAGRCACCAIC